jgi:hypothetical protein
LNDVSTGPNRQLAAMSQLDAAGSDEAYIDALHRVVWRPGYTVEARAAAVDRLEVYDLDGLKRTLRQQLPRMEAWEGLTRLCDVIAEKGWVDLTPALVSSWARPVATISDESTRPEYQALITLHGEDDIQAVVFRTLMESDAVWQQGLRTRCWELLHRLGERDRLIALLNGTDVPADDAFLLDLKAAADDFGLVPYNREEILWLRKLRQPEHTAFWSEAVDALGAVPPDRRAQLELRDVPVVVSAVKHDPELLTLSEGALYGRLEAALDGERHYSHGSNFNSFNARGRERLYDWRHELTWSDLAAMHIAVRALGVPQVVDHLFDYADRDQDDESTEYGGVIRLDHRGRFEILEFPPRIRHHDQKFIASQEMFDAGYTAQFHFHMHVQRHRNDEYAGPGLGDLQYATATRANCLVLTFVNRDTMNVDYYRHGGVKVDLGVIERPGT